MWAALGPPRSRRRLARPALVVGAHSLLTTFVGTSAADVAESGGSSWKYWKLIEVGLLLVPLAVTTRWAPARQAVPAGLATGAAVAFWTLPLVPSASLLERTGAAVFWSLPALAAAGTLRWPGTR